VEVAFFFPWAAVFGKATNLDNENFAVVDRAADGQISLTKDATALYQELGVRQPTAPLVTPPSLVAEVTAADDVTRSAQIIHKGANQLAWVTMADIAVFFAVLLIGFAYVWRRGDLDWVRAVGQARAAVEPRTGSDDPLEQEAALSA
jgi:NADH-quinone oxidoreductase subunit A